MAADLGRTKCGGDEPGDVGEWLASLGRKVELDDLTPELMGAAMGWLRDYESGFDWLVHVKSRLLATGGLSMREVTGVLNSWRAAILRADRGRQAGSVEVAGAVVDLDLVPSGRYAVKRSDGHVVFYQVDRGRGRWAGYVFIGQLVGGGRLQYVGRIPPGQRYGGGRRLDMAEIARDPEAGARLFGRELGICAICGRSLTDDASRSAGVGPRCAFRFARMRLGAASGRNEGTAPARRRALRLLRERQRQPERPAWMGPPFGSFQPTISNPEVV